MNKYLAQTNKSHTTSKATKPQGFDRKVGSHDWNPQLMPLNPSHKPCLHSACGKPFYFLQQFQCWTSAKSNGLSVWLAPKAFASITEARGGPAALSTIVMALPEISAAQVTLTGRQSRRAT
jgi:hypothetical protein